MVHMRVIFPVRYPIVGKTKTTKGNVSKWFEELVPLDIPEVEPFLAPIAVRWKPTADTVHDPATVDRCISGDDGFQLTRWFENAHWQRLCEGHFGGKHQGGKNLTVELFQTLLAQASPGSDALLKMGLHPGPTTPGNGKLLRVETDPSSNFEAIKFSGRTETMARLHAASNVLISVGGVLHRRCAEPFASVSLHFKDGKLQCQDIGIEASLVALWDAKRVNANFSLGDWRKAEEFALEQGLEGFDTYSHAPEIFIPESLSDQWNLAYRVGMAITFVKKSLWLSPTAPMGLLTEAIRCHDVSRQFEIMSKIKFDEDTWRNTSSLRQSYAEVMDLLDEMPVSLGLTSSHGSSPAGP